MFELNGKPVDLDFLQGKAKEYNMDFDSYIKKMESKGLTEVEPGKITPPKEESQGVPVEVNATPEIQPTFGTLDLDSNLVNTLLESPNKENQKQFLNSVESFHKDDLNNNLKSLLKKYDAGFLTNENKINPGLNAVDSAIYKDRLDKVNKEYNNFYNNIAQKEYEALLNNKAKEFETFDPTSGLTIGQNFALGVAKTFESLFDISEDGIGFSSKEGLTGISKGPLLNAKDAFTAAKNLDAYSSAERSIEARKQRIIQQGQDEGWSDKVLQQQLNLFTDPTNSSGKKIANSEEEYKDFLKINKANSSLEMLSKLVKADQQFLQQLKEYGPDTEILDKNGNINLSFGKTARITGQQFTQLLFSAATAPVAPGRATYMQEIGPMMTEALEQAAIKEFGKESIAKMSESDKQEKYITLIEDGKLDLSKLETSAIFSGLLDTAGTVFQGVKIAKAGAPLLRNIFKRKFQETLKIAVSKGADIGLATAGETLTEVAQEGLNVMGVAEAAGTKQNWAGKRFGEVGLQTLITTPLLVGGGRGVKSTATQLKRAVQGAYDPNSLRAEINNQIKVVNMLEKNKSITSDQAANEIDNLYATEDVISNSLYKNFEPEAKVEMIDIIAKEKGIKTKIDKLKNTYDADSVFSAGQVKALEEQLKEIENKKQDVVPLQNYLLSSKKLLKHINNNSEKYNNYKAFSFNTNDELIDFAIRNDISEELITNITAEKDFAFGAEVSNKKMILFSKENIKKAKGKDKVVGSNVVHHEFGHVVMSSLPDSDINNFIKNIRTEAEKLPEGSKLKEAFEKAKARVKTSYSDQSNRVKSEEILTSMSDFLRVLDEDILVDDASFLSKTFSFLAEKLNLATDEQIDFSGLAEPRQALQFFQKYNKSLGNSKNLFQRIKKVSTTSAKPEVSDEIEKFSKSISGENIQQIFDEKGKDGAFDIIEAYKPLTTKLTNKYRNVPGFDFELLQSEIEIGKRGLLDLINAYDPSKGATLNTYVQGQLANRSIEAANRILDTEFTVDVTEAKGVTDTATEEAIETQEQAEIADEIKSLRKEIGLPEGLVTDVKNAVVKTFGTKLPNPQDPKFRFELQKRFRTELKKPMLQFVGKQADYESFLRDNFEPVYSKMPQSLINRRFKEFAEPVLDKNGKQVREKTAEGNKVYVKKKINKAEWIKYFLGAEVGGSTKGARKTAIVEGIAEEIAFDATMEVLNDPDVIQKYQDIAGITGEVLPENFKSIIAKQVDRAENFKFSKSIANNAKAEYNLESQELARILDKTSLDKLSDKYSLISDAIIYEADPNSIKFSLTTKADGKWEQEPLNPLDESSKLYKFQVGEINYEIKTFKDPDVFNYDIFESTMGIEDGATENDPKSWAIAFADALDGSTDLTGVATQGLTNQFKVFGTVANATIDLIKKEKLNSITFSGKEKSRKRLYRSLSDKFAKELGWEAYDFEGEAASGAETVFIVYNPKAFPVEEQLENEKIKFSNSVDKSFMPANEIIELASLLNVRPTKKNVRNALAEIFDIIQKDPNAYENYEEIYDKWLKPYIEFKEKAQTLKWPAAEKRVYNVLLDLQSEGFNITNISLNTNSQKVDIQFELKGKKFLIEVKKNEEARLSSIFLREDYDKNIFTSNPADKKYIEEIIKKDKTRNIIPDWIQKNYPNEIKYELKDGQRIPIVTNNALKAAFRVLKAKKIKHESTFKKDIGLVESIYKTKARKAENQEGVPVEAIIIDFGDLGSFYIGENKLNLPIPALTQDINVDVRIHWKPQKRKNINFNGKVVKKAFTLWRVANPSLDLNAKETLSKTKTLSLQNKYQAAQLLDKSKFSKSLNKGFNQILEESTGVKWAERFSPAKARVMAKGKGKGAIFVPYSADDFVGLLYTTLAGSEKGNQQMDWYRENLLRPFSRGIQAYESEKQRAMREWSVLKQRAKKDVPGGLTKQNESGFTNEQSLRMYMWQKQGFDIPNIKKGEVNDAIKAVNKNEKFKSFADNLMALNSEGYPKPENNWVDGDITTDLIGYINKTKRSEFLSEWQENVNEIFSEKNITKLRGLYGERYVEALENILYRMKTGVNRKFGTSKQERAWMDWVNNSVGAIMFFNARSAVLQTLSTVNFINFSDNNPINAAIALANFGQYRKDFVNLFNSDFLKQRRSGLQTDISADEIAKATKGNERSPRALFNALLKIGFTPTQIADSFAIASGGATFYRNRINKYVKEGLTKQEAEQKAFTDFQEIAEETQQSSRPDRVSMEQAGSLGRVVLAFANTPMQYARLQKKAALDLYNGRGDWKTNISKIAYYGVIQNIIFSSLQSALFTLLFDDEEEPEKKEKYFRVANSSADTFLRGVGVYGAAASTVKNVILEIIDQAKSNRPDYTKAAIAATSISPPINSKLRKLISAGNTFKYKQSRKKVFNEGLSLENPAFLAAGKVISAGTNIPADRIVTKLDHIKTAMEPETELWQAIALSLGWGEWELGMIEKQTKKSKTPLRKNRKTIKRKTATRKTAN